MELITVVNWMGALKISSVNITAFLREMEVHVCVLSSLNEREILKAPPSQGLNMIDKERQAALMDMVVPLPSFEESAFETGPFGASSYKELTSPRSKRRANPMHADAVIKDLLESAVVPTQKVVWQVHAECPCYLLVLHCCAHITRVLGFHDDHGKHRVGTSEHCVRV